MTARELGGYRTQAATKQPQNNSWELELQTSVYKNDKSELSKKAKKLNTNKTQTTRV